MGERMFDAEQHPRVPVGAGGGEFTTGGAGKTPAKQPAHGKPVGHSHPVAHRRPAGPLKSTLSYSAKTNRGAGYGTSGGDPHVHDVQQALNRLGLTDTAGKKLKDDGKLGPRTTAAIKKAQKALGLKQDGLLTPDVYKRLLATKNLPAHRSADPMTTQAPDMPMSPADQELCDLLAGLTDDDVNELAALAEAMHADGGA